MICNIEIEINRFYHPKTPIFLADGNIRFRYLKSISI